MWLGRKTACQETEWLHVSSQDPGAPAQEAAAWHWSADCVFRVWGYQNPQLISVEATILWGWVRTLDLAPCGATRNYAVLFTHLAEVESWPGLRGLRLRPRARGAHKGWTAGYLARRTLRMLWGSLWGDQDGFPLSPGLSLPAKEAEATVLCSNVPQSRCGQGFEEAYAL